MDGGTSPCIVMRTTPLPCSATTGAYIVHPCLEPGESIFATSRCSCSSRSASDDIPSPGPFSGETNHTPSFHQTKPAPPCHASDNHEQGLSILAALLLAWPLARGVGRRCRSGCWSPASVGSRESGHGCVHMSLLPPFYVFLLPHPPSQEQQGHPPGSPSARRSSTRSARRPVICSPRTTYSPTRPWLGGRRPF